MDNINTGRLEESLELYVEHLFDKANRIKAAVGSKDFSSIANVLVNEGITPDLQMNSINKGNWEQVLNAAKKVDPNDYFVEGSFISVKFAQDITRKFLELFCLGTSIYTYVDGVYVPGDTYVMQLSIELLKHGWKSQYVNEALKWIKNALICDTELINPNDGLINVHNGLLNWESGELLPHDPKRLSTIKLPVDYVPEANDPIVMDFISSVVPSDTIHTLLEMVGYCLMPHTKYEKAVLLVGSGGNGKSTFINMLTALLGKQNTSNISLHDIESHKFKLAQLQSKLLNTFADLPKTSLPNTSNFKAIVSGDSLSVEHKHKDPFNYRPFAKLLFSTNELPQSSDNTEGYFRRWIVIPFEAKFKGDSADVHLIERLTTPQALSTLLNLAIEGARRLKSQGAFSQSETVKRMLSEYRFDNDYIALFVSESCILNDGLKCLTTELFAAYEDWATASRIKPINRQKFYKEVTRILGSEKKRRHGDPCESWRGIGLRQNGS